MKIVGISLIKNEDLYIEQVLKNTLDFCDEIIVLDNMSEDKTYDIVEKMSRGNQKIKLFRIEDFKKSHKFIEKYANTETWIFRIDGDEIYDPKGLERLHREVLDGNYQNFWRIEGNSLNCREIDKTQKIAKGYLSPPSKPAPMLYNFSLLESWIEEDAERLHGKNITFKQGFNRDLRLPLFEKLSWEESYFRCLHLCFIPRSSLDKSNVRLNPNEKRMRFASLINFIRNLIHGRISIESNYKLEKYKKGPIKTKSIENFL